MELTQERLRELLDYYPDTGMFVWKKRNGKIAGSFSKQSGYINIQIDRKVYRAHRLAWLYCHGYMPSEQVDHINRLRDDNRIDNLREADYVVNAQNHKNRKDNNSGYKGINFDVKEDTWVARIQVDGKRMFLGRFDNLTNAIEARKQAEIEYNYNKG